MTVKRAEESWASAAADLDGRSNGAVSKRVVPPLRDRGSESLSLSGESYANLTSSPSTVQMLDAEPGTVTPGFGTRETRILDRKTAPLSGDWQANSPRRQPVATQRTARIPQRDEGNCDQACA
jgi:hypothetical protein